MCGIIGEYFLTNPLIDDLFDLNTIQNHRGPDSRSRIDLLHQGKPVATFAHQRLSILNLDESGNQPMTSYCGRYTIVFNGEVYNYIEIDKKYGFSYFEEGDTRVLIELISKNGIKGALSEIIGFWALAIFDNTDGSIHLSRDRLGKKPLYYYRSESNFLFASELNSFSASKLPKTLNMSKIKVFIEKGLHPISQTWFSEISELSPGKLIKIEEKNESIIIKEIVKFSHYDLQFDNHPNSECYGRELIKNSVKIRLRSDTPVGVAVSGGIDSSIIASLANEINDVSLYSICRVGDTASEYKYSEILSKYLNKKINYLDPLEGEKLWESLKTLSSNLDGPFSSFSQVQFHQLCKKCNEDGIKVLLTGQGADEVYLGYKKYPVLMLFSALKQFDFKMALSAIKILWVLIDLSDINFFNLKKFTSITKNNFLGEKVKKYNPEMTNSVSWKDTVNNAAIKDLTYASVPYLLKYEDRMGMAASVEVRNPFLDTRVVTHGLHLPISMKLCSGWTKYFLRNKFKDILPAEITWRRDKKGFVSPERAIFMSIRKPVLKMLDEKCYIYEYGLIDKEIYYKEIESYMNGKKTNFRTIFYPLSLELFLRSCNNVIS